MLCLRYLCLIKCQHLEIGLDAASTEIGKIINGDDSFVLHDYVTCYACEEIVQTAIIRFI